MEVQVSCGISGLCWILSRISATRFIGIGMRFFPSFFALEAEGWRRAEHPTKEMSAELLQEESFEDFLFAPCSSDIQSYFRVLSVGDWEQLLKEYIEDNTDAIPMPY